MQTFNRMEQEEEYFLWWFLFLFQGLIGARMISAFQGSSDWDTIISSLKIDSY